MYGYIYESVNLVNGRKYIGQKKGEFDPMYFGSGKILMQAVSKYGTDNFVVTVLTECETLAENNTAEILAISNANATESNMYYNIAAGGDGGNTRKGMSEERFAEYCASLKEAQNRPEVLAKRSATSKAVYDRPGVREKLAKHSQEKWTPELRKQMSESSKIAGQNPETKRRRHAAALRREADPEYKRKKAEAIKDRKMYNDGVKTYACKPNDQRIKDLNLKLGRHKRKNK